MDANWKTPEKVEKDEKNKKKLVELRNQPIFTSYLEYCHNIMYVYVGLEF